MNDDVAPELFDVWMSVLQSDKIRFSEKIYLLETVYLYDLDFYFLVEFILCKLNLQHTYLTIQSSVNYNKS